MSKGIVGWKLTVKQCLLKKSVFLEAWKGLRAQRQENTHCVLGYFEFFHSDAAPCMIWQLAFLCHRRVKFKQGLFLDVFILIGKQSMLVHWPAENWIFNSWSMTCILDVKIREIVSKGICWLVHRLSKAIQECSGF